MLEELRRWGVEHAPPPQRDDAVRPAWILGSAGAAPAAPVPDGRTCELTVGGEVFTLTDDGSGFAVRGGPAVAPDASVTVDEASFLALAVGQRARARRGWKVTGGDATLARAFHDAIAGSVAASAPGSVIRRHAGPSVRAWCGGSVGSNGRSPPASPW